MLFLFVCQRIEPFSSCPANLPCLAAGFFPFRTRAAQTSGPRVRKQRRGNFHAQAVHLRRQRTDFPLRAAAHAQAEEVPQLAHIHRYHHARFASAGQHEPGILIAALARAGIRFGLSTHDEAERERALSHDPAYIALGPIYPTLLKQMPWAPQGLERLAAWKAAIGTRPLVAIGGLTPERLPGVFAAGADSAAVVTDIVTAKDPEARCDLWLRATR